MSVPAGTAPVPPGCDLRGCRKRALDPGAGLGHSRPMFEDPAAPILHDSLPEVPWAAAGTRRLPGTQPLAMADWLRVDTAFAAQMALRERLLAGTPETVLAEAATDPAREMLETVLDWLPPGYRRDGDRVIRPDGGAVTLDRDRPLATLGRLHVADFCLMEKTGPEHVLTAAVLCFPARWRLAEKLGRPLTAIHDPVPPYDGDIAARVQRMFDLMRPEAPLWRVNAALTDDPRLSQPEPNHGRRVAPTGRAGYIRSERQGLVKLPRSGAVVFSIETRVIRLAALSAAQAAALAEHPITEAG